jgi:glycosyltransferase involved in cell wall biosynthesis
VSRPTISVVIPAFDAEPFLAESIRSTLDQDLEPLEVIVVDDGSADATSEVAASFGDAVRLVRHADNRGEAAARNTGVAEARGDCIAMHDADDRMLADRLRVQLDALVAGGPSTGCVLAQMRTFSADGSPLPAWALDADGEPITYGNSPVLAWRTTYDRVGGYDESLVTGTDSDWLVRVRAAGLEVGLIEQVLLERRVHDTNLSARHGTNPRGYLVALRKVLTERRAAG